jgi:hypothetical protein
VQHARLDRKQRIARRIKKEKRKEVILESKRKNIKERTTKISRIHLVSA